MTHAWEWNNGELKLYHIKKQEFWEINLFKENNNASLNKHTSNA